MLHYKFSSPIGVSLISITWKKAIERNENGVFVPYRGLFNFNSEIEVVDNDTGEVFVPYRGLFNFNLIRLYIELGGGFCFRPLSGSL